MSFQVDFKAGQYIDLATKKVAVERDVLLRRIRKGESIMKSRAIGPAVLFGDPAPRWRDPRLFQHTEFGFFQPIPYIEKRRPHTTPGGVQRTRHSMSDPRFSQSRQSASRGSLTGMRKSNLGQGQSSANLGAQQNRAETPPSAVSAATGGGGVLHRDTNSRESRRGDVIGRGGISIDNTTVKIPRTGSTLRSSLASQPTLPRELGGADVQMLKRISSSYGKFVERPSCKDIESTDTGGTQEGYRSQEGLGGSQTGLGNTRGTDLNLTVATTLPNTTGGVGSGNSGNLRDTPQYRDTPNREPAITFGGVDRQSLQVSPQTTGGSGAPASGSGAGVATNQNMQSQSPLQATSPNPSMQINPNATAHPHYHTYREQIPSPNYPRIHGPSTELGATGVSASGMARQSYGTASMGLWLLGGNDAIAERQPFAAAKDKVKEMQDQEEFGFDMPWPTQLENWRSGNTVDFPLPGIGDCKCHLDARFHEPAPLPPERNFIP